MPGSMVPGSIPRVWLSTSKLAQLMIQGSTMGTVEMTRRIHQYTGKADPELLALGSRLLHTEEQNIQQMKRFL